MFQSRDFSRERARSTSAMQFHVAVQSVDSDLVRLFLIVRRRHIRALCARDQFKSRLMRLRETEREREADGHLVRQDLAGVPRGRRTCATGACCGDASVECTCECTYARVWRSSIFLRFPRGAQTASAVFPDGENYVREVARRTGYVYPISRAISISVTVRRYRL